VLAGAEAHPCFLQNQFAEILHVADFLSLHSAGYIGEEVKGRLRLEAADPRDGVQQIDQDIPSFFQDGQDAQRPSVLPESGQGPVLDKYS
jgi:hypothetical protein